MSAPRPTTRFFGRARDLDELEAACASGATPITLWGPPGIGKTRLAIELCRRVERAWFCDASAARDTNELCACVMRALGVDLASPVDMDGVAVALKRQGRGVLVLDDVERVATHTVSILARWMDAAPALSFVTTSRTRLRLDTEHAREVEPLREARELFLDRAGKSGEDLQPDDVDALVARLEGIPLAIELAAARAGVLGLRDILARIDRPLEAIDGGSTLARTIASSIRSLTPEQRRVLAQCAVFRGNFGVGEVEAVVDADSSTLFDVLQALRERSLLRCAQGSASARFAFFEPIRARALVELRAIGVEAATRRRHALHYLGTVTCDSSNLADALAWAFGDETTARAFAGEALATLSRMDPSTITDALVERLEEALALVSDDCNPTLRANGHRAHARSLALRGDVAGARAELERALALAADDEALASELRADVGVIEQRLGDVDRARECYETALAASTRDRRCRARLLGNLGTVAHDAGRLDDALQRYEEVIAIFRAGGERELEGTFLVNLAVLLQEMGAMPRARATFQIALERLEGASQRMEAIARTNLGLLCHELGELEEARACHERALELLRQVTDSRSEGLCVGRLAMALAALGMHDDALARCERAESILRSAGDWHALEVAGVFRAYVEWMCARDLPLARERLLHARSLSTRSDDARTTMRLIASELAPVDAAARVLLVGPKASWFSPPDGRKCDLTNRRVLRRLLWRLVESHRGAVEAGVTLDELRAAAWPEEKATAVAAQNRVHVALTELRRRGLRECLQRAGSRYFIDPKVRVELRD